MPFVVGAFAKVGDVVHVAEQVAILPEDLDAERLRIAIAPQKPK